MRKNALILIEGNMTGTGHLYVQAAKRLGLFPITLSTDPNRYDYLAEEQVGSFIVDTSDATALIQACAQLAAFYRIVGITGAREAVYANVGKLCRHFGLPGPKPAAIQRCCNKLAQIECLYAADVPVPAFRLATGAADAARAAAELGLPVVLKPTVGNSSTGVRLCRSLEELAEHTAYLFGRGHAWSSEPRILVQAFADGPWYSVNTMGSEVVAIAGADFGAPPHFVFREFICPARLSPADYQRIADVSRRCVQALDLTWGPSNVEVRLTPSGPVVIEVNPRLAGTPDPQLIKLAHGIDLILEAIKLCISDEADLRKKHARAAGLRFLIADREGILEWIAGEGAASVVPDVVEVKLYAEPQTPIVLRGDFRDVIGHVIAASSTRQRAADALQQAVEFIGWSIAPPLGADEQKHA